VPESDYDPVNDNALWWQLHRQLPVGRFKLDKEDRIVWVDQGWLELYSFKNESEVLDEHISIVSSEGASKADEIRRKVVGSGPDGVAYVDTCLMKKHTGEYFFCQIHTTGLWKDRNYQGRIGIVQDVTAQKIHPVLVDNSPVPFYIIKRVQGKGDVIVYCNNAFSELFKFPNRQDAIDFPAVKLYANQKDHERFLQYIKSHPNSFIVGRKIRVITQDAREFTADTNVMWRNDDEGKFRIRMGTLRDLSKDETYTEAIRQFGIVQHSYQTSIISIRHSLDAILDTLQPSPFKRGKDIYEEEARKEIGPPMATVHHLITELSRLPMEKPENDTFLGPLLVKTKYLDAKSSLQWGELLPTRLQVSTAIIDICERWMEYVADSEDKIQLLTEIKQNAMHLQRLILQVLIHRLQAALLEIGKKIRSFQESATLAVRTTEPETSFDLWAVIMEAMENLEDYAQSKDVTFKPDRRVRTAAIYGRRRELLRAFANILHNAVKYSLHRTRGRWVDVKLDAITKNAKRCYRIRITNYGIGISAEELRADKIFEFGYRGEWSGQSGRGGTGMGLTDTKWIIERHGGEVKIASHPAHSNTSQADDHPTPYLTSVTILLPLSKEGCDEKRVMDRR